MKKYSDRYVKRVGRVTNRIFRQAVVDVLKLKKVDAATISAAVHDVRLVKLIGQQRDTDVTPIHAEQIDVLYLELILQLPSKDLNSIVNCHKTKQINRASRTIETIMNELTSRGLLNDSNQSDLNNPHGDTDELTK